ncbi:NFX1-type zinc finger-containing protein 1-like [Lingula anatina]|uniref:NFX1-type zinc finger-containing protein 1-like n=1 Tax=Lingula anatina TaxID=7574 RepID=A0A1S3IUT2_LINAN|nr:NFX1-type zinc finger-containing protein 1-like [Lingula anatina]|eukprot:XP_013401833.1 NFX1-type zinc finger-containing protein 1-like [Lingula anatina]
MADGNRNENPQKPPDLRLFLNDRKRRHQASENNAVNERRGYERNSSRLTPDRDRKRFKLDKSSDSGVTKFHRGQRIVERNTNNAGTIMHKDRMYQAGGYYSGRKQRRHFNMEVDRTRNIRHSSPSSAATFGTTQRRTIHGNDPNTTASSGRSVSLFSSNRHPSADFNTKKEREDYSFKLQDQRGMPEIDEYPSRKHQWPDLRSTMHDDRAQTSRRAPPSSTATLGTAQRGNLHRNVQNATASSEISTSTFQSNSLSCAEFNPRRQRTDYRFQPSKNRISEVDEYPSCRNQWSHLYTSVEASTTKALRPASYSTKTSDKIQRKDGHRYSSQLGKRKMCEIDDRPSLRNQRSCLHTSEQETTLKTPRRASPCSTKPAVKTPRKYSDRNDTQIVKSATKKRERKDWCKSDMKAGIKRVDQRARRSSSFSSSSRNVSRGKTSTDEALGYKQLENISLLEPDKVALELGLADKRFIKLLEMGNLSDDRLRLIVKTLANVSSSTYDHIKRGLLRKVYNTNFLENGSYLITFISGLRITFQSSQDEDFLKQLTKVLREIIITINVQSIMQKLLTLINALDATVQGIVEKCQDPNEMEEHRNSLNHIIDTCISRVTRKANNIEEGPPDVFAEISVLPSKEDLLQNETFLRVNREKGSYESLHDYLDVQFRLMREDFVQPLRASLQDCFSHKRVDNIYKKIHILPHGYIDPSPSVGVVFRVQFDTSPLKHVRWKYSKRLRPGTLVLLFTDDLKYMVYGTVVDRDIKALQKGIVGLHFISSTKDVHSLMSEEYQMVESPAFFKEYEPILESLRRFNRMENPENFPFIKYLVYAETAVSPPYYLTVLKNEMYTLGSPTFCLESTDVASSSKLNCPTSPSCDTTSPIHIPELDEEYALESKQVKGSEILYDFSPLLQNNADTGDRFRGERKLPAKRLVDKIERIAPVFDLDKWPTAQDLGLDESQRKAIHLALTKELAIIQGPPGTGKTHVGYKLVQLLLQNGDKRHNSTSNSQILIICYTNHALDQFLEGILSTSGKHIKRASDMIRVGSRSKSEILKKHSLREIKRDILLRVNSGRKEISRFISMANRKLIYARKRFKEVHNLLETIESRTCIYSEDVLFRNGCMTSNQKDTLHAGYCTPNRPIMLQWLDVFNVSGSVKNSVRQISVQETEEAEPGEIISDDEVDPVLMEYNEAYAEVYEGPAWTKKQKVHEACFSIMNDYTLDTCKLEIDLENNALKDFWETIHPKGIPHIIQKVRRELQDVDNVLESSKVQNVWSLSISDRWKLYRAWVTHFHQSVRKQVIELQREYEDELALHKEIQSEENFQVLRHAKIIGLTTTGSALCQKTLEKLQPQIIIVEEAAECMESHIISSLTESTQHLILIGDHQQLKPRPAVYALAKKYKLEVSLFERLINNKLPYVCLQEQHRMRPEFAKLLVPDFYDRLDNHVSVLNIEPVRGVKQSLFFVTHTQAESNEFEKSPSNKHEADFIVALHRYLLQQGYDSQDITILTAYSGQANHLRKLMKTKDDPNTTSKAKIPDGNNCNKTLDKESPISARITTVDNFQGEENKIILLSLVRSNEEGKIGFMETSNRVCVALSRAKEGFYAIGDFSLYRKKSDLWRKLTDKLYQEKNMGDALNLCCPNHPDTITKVQCKEDFNKVPEGGCRLLCQTRLRCGHTCPRMCHSDDMKHEYQVCNETCRKKMCSRAHRCKKPCYSHKNCGPCSTKVEKVMPKCAHKQMVPCHIPETHFPCKERCEKVLPCGHICQRKCGEECTTPSSCRSLVRVTLKCGHEVQTSCNIGKNAACSVPCEASLQNCDHQCSGTCGECMQGRLHKACTAQCGRILLCGHECNMPCAKSCPPCFKRCEIRCIHNRCTRKCSKICRECAEPCGWSCKHHKCSRLCFEICDREPCNEPCEDSLPCGHPCMGLCGEQHPKLCRICDKHKVQDILEWYSDEENDSDARLVMLTDCEHVFERNFLDRWMAVEQESDTRSIQLKVCPICRKPLYSTQRYGNIFKQKLRDVQTVRERILRETRSPLFLEQKRNLIAQLEDRKRKVSSELGIRLLNEVKKCKTSYILRSLQGISLSLIKIDQLDRQFCQINDEITQFDYNIEDVLFLDENFIPSVSDVREDILKLKMWLSKKRTLSEYQSDQLVKEVQRLTLAGSLFQILISIISQFKGNPVENKEEMDRLTEHGNEAMGGFKQINTRHPPTEETLESVTRLISSLKQYSGPDTESLKLVVKAMDFGPQSHWYKCPNGHIYCVTECGMPMEESVCPECQEVIGGENHRLRSDNQEVDINVLMDT